MNDVSISQAFQAGENYYWSGGVPHNWNSVKARMTDPFVMGWYLASQADNGLDLDLRG